MGRYGNGVQVEEDDTGEGKGLASCECTEV